MGMMIFTMASGLTLVFGMMDVLNFGHGAFIALGAYVATLVFLPLANWSQADSLPLNLAVFALAIARGRRRLRRLRVRLRAPADRSRSMDSTSNRFS